MKTKISFIYIACLNAFVSFFLSFFIMKTLNTFGYMQVPLSDSNNMQSNISHFITFTLRL